MADINIWGPNARARFEDLRLRREEETGKKQTIEQTVEHTQNEPPRDQHQLLQDTPRQTSPASNLPTETADLSPQALALLQSS